MNHFPNSPQPEPASQQDAGLALAVKAARQSLQRMGKPFRHANFRLFFGGQFVSLLGTWMQSVALSWMVYRVTGSSASLGLVGFAGQIPIFFFALFGGAVADRLSKRQVLLATQTVSMLQAGALTVLAFRGDAQLWQLVALALVLGLANAIDHPTRLAFLVELVGKEDLHNAIGLNSSMFHCARMLGPALAGALLALVGEAWCFLINALSYVAVIGALLCMRLAPRTETATQGMFLKSILDGVDFACRSRELRALLIMTAVCGLFGTCYLTLMPVFAAKIYACGPRGFGFLMASTGAGSLVGALALAMRPAAEGLWRWRFWSGVGLGASLLAFALAPAIWIGAPLAALTGLFMLLLAVTSHTLMQFATSDALRGRVMALYSMLFLGMAPFGALAAGALAERVGAPWTVALSGAVCLIAALLFGRRPRAGA
jgi:MFS family permease